MRDTVRNGGDMSLSDALQIAACLLLPLGIFLAVMAIHSVLLGAGMSAVVAAVELWFVGREIDLQGG